jgi:hypothetical protein
MVFPMPARGLPQTIMGYVFRHSGKHQVCLAVLSAAVFTLSAIPLELQRAHRQRRYRRR